MITPIPNQTPRSLSALLKEASTFDPRDTHYTEQRANVVAALIDYQTGKRLPPGPVPGQVIP